MNFTHLFERIKGILLKPADEWPKVASESQSNKQIILYYVLPLAAIAAIISLFAVWSNTYLGFGLALRFAVLKLVMPILSVVLTAVIVNELADTFDSSKNLNNAFKLVAYSYTPALLAAIITSISWTLSWVALFGLYGVYLLWVGLSILMKTPEDKRLVYIIAIVALMLVINAIISALFGIERLGYY